VSQTERPLTPTQLRLLRAIRSGSRRAAEVAARSGEQQAGVYALLARLIGRGLVRKSGPRPPSYHLTDKGERWLEASEGFLQTVNGR
jgi:DNA-binding MarR family transcriptional regulator